jgi:hypothetical protein
MARLPPNNRRWLRLVCRHWRHIVDTRTVTDLRNRTKTLVVTRDMTLYVFDDLSTGFYRDLRIGVHFDFYKGMTMVGTCNGLICLCDNRSGAITLFNPVIPRETLAIPLLPSPYAGGSREWHRTYSFTYHPETGRYMILHIP